MRNISLLIHLLKNRLLAGLLIVGFGNFQQSLQASAAEPLPFKVIEFKPYEHLTLKCLGHQATSTLPLQVATSSTLSEPTLRYVQLKFPSQFKNTTWISGALQLWELTHLWLLGKEKLEWIYGSSRAEAIQCGQAVQLVRLQERLKKIGRLISEIKIEETGNTQGIADMSFFALVPNMEKDGTLILSIEPRRIHDIKIATGCNWSHWEVDRRGTVPINGQKPDALIRRILGVAPEDRLPSMAVVASKMEEIWSLGLFREVAFGLGVENDPDKLDWIVCVEQKSEAELTYDEAERIDSQTSAETRRAIDKYQTALRLFQQTKTASREYERLPDIEIRRYSFMSLLKVRTVNFGERLPTRTEADALIKIAANYKILGEFYQALHYFSQALSVTQQTSDKDRELDVLTQIADIYNVLGDQKNAHLFYDQVLFIRLTGLRRQQQENGGTP